MSATSSYPHVNIRTAAGIDAINVSNIYGIGRNYGAHARELGNAIPGDPIVFMKPTSALIYEPNPIILPPHSEDVNFEAELVLLIGEVPQTLTTDNAMMAIKAYGLGLDLTARDVQTHLKQNALPWMLAKGFKGSAPVSEFLLAEQIIDIQKLQFNLWIDETIRQQGDPAYMLFSMAEIICFLDKHFGLLPGDLIFTGTPEGVGQLLPGQKLELQLQHYPLQAQFTVQTYA